MAKDASGAGNLEREERIFEAAIKLMSRYGYDKTTVDDIAREAGISKGAVYLHFRSKEDLVESLLLRESESMLNEVMRSLEADEKGLTIYTLYRYSMQSLMTHPFMKAMYARDQAVLGDFARRLAQLPMYNQANSFGSAFVEQFQEAGMIRRDLPSEAVAHILMAIRVGVLHLSDYLPTFDEDAFHRMGDVLASVLEQALAPPPDAVNPIDQQKGYEALNVLINVGHEMIRQQREQHRQAMMDKDGKGKRDAK